MLAEFGDLCSVAAIISPGKLGLAGPVSTVTFVLWGTAASKKRQLLSCRYTWLGYLAVNYSANN